MKEVRDAVLSGAEDLRAFVEGNPGEIKADIGKQSGDLLGVLVRHYGTEALDTNLLLATLVRVGNDASYLGEAYTLLPIAAAMYFIGSAKGSDHFRETGMLSFETIADVTTDEFVRPSIRYQREHRHFAEQR